MCILYYLKVVILWKCLGFLLFLLLLLLVFGDTAQHSCMVKHLLVVILVTLIPHGKPIVLSPSSASQRCNKGHGMYYPVC